jgi:DNA invertase Pin-like site-specific DNA recombinase
MKIVGYARVSSDDQNLSSQIDALLNAGVSRQHLFCDQVSGAKADRPGLSECLNTLQPGDSLLVWRLDRLGRSMQHLVNVVEDLRQKGIGFKSICDGAIDTTTASGELVFNMFSSLAQFERRLIQERTNAGLKSARARGRLGGRPKLDKDAPKIRLARKMHDDKSVPIEDICTSLKISRATLYRYLQTL